MRTCSQDSNVSSLSKNLATITLKMILTHSYCLMICRHAADSEFASWLRSLEDLDEDVQPHFTKDIHLHLLGFLQTISGTGDYGGVSKLIA